MLEAAVAGPNPSSGMAADAENLNLPILPPYMPMFVK
jgi:hypothetical protein